MVKYIFQRILWLIVIVFCVAVLIFTIMFFVPGDPARIILGDTATAEDLARMRTSLGLDQPFYVQLLEYLKQTFVQFDLGTSYITQLPVWDEFVDRLPRTFLLGFLTMVFSCLIGIPLGIYSAIKRNGVVDHCLRIGSMLFASMPSFWLALLMVQIFSINLKLLPSHGIGGITYWILPVAAGALGSIGSNARMTRSAVLETVRADYIATARAKGQSEGKIITRHMLPNAMIPIVNQLSGAFTNLIAGSVVLETVFAFPGIGLYMMTAISNRDYPVIRSSVLVLAIYSAVIVLITDLIYAYLDPRIKAQYVKQKKRHEGEKDESQK